MKATKKIKRWQPQMLSVMRVVVALLFVEHGMQKIFGFPPAPHPSPAPPIFSQQGIGAWLELVGGVLLFLGFGTRFVAFILSGEMAVAYFQFHAPDGLWPANNKGEPAALYCWVFLYLVFVGAGPWSIDALFKRKSASSTR